MWCVNCHQAFSWKTGEIDNGVVHNPHFYQYERDANNGELPRQAGDVLCGGLIAWHHLNGTVIRHLNAIEILTEKYSEKHIIHEVINKLMYLHRFMSHITYVTIDSLRQKVRELADTEKTRISYILKGITQEELATSVYKTDVNRRKTTELLNIYELINVVGIEMFTTIINFERLPGTDTIYQYLETIMIEIERFQNLLDYCNEQFANISITYNNNVVQLIKNDNKIIICTKKFKKGEIKEIEELNQKKNEIERKHMDKFGIPLFVTCLRNFVQEQAMEGQDEKNLKTTNNLNDKIKLLRGNKNETINVIHHHFRRRRRANMPDEDPLLEEVAENLMNEFDAAEMAIEID